MSIELLCMTVGALALIQSLVGVGILIFGTPLLLVLDIPFGTILSTLLPASLTVSLMQMAIDRGVQRSTAIGFLKFMLPPLCAGLVFSLFLSAPHLDVVIVTALVFTALVRLSSRGRTYLLGWAKQNSTLMQVAIGLVHGLSNMGGSLLEVYASSRFQGKADIRQHIALGYALLAGSQLGILALSGNFTPINGTMYIVGSAALVYLLLGRRIFLQIPQDRFRSVVTVTILLAAVALAVKKMI